MIRVFGVPVAVTCSVLGFGNNGYYLWRARQVTERDWFDADLVNEALGIHADERTLGYRFIACELPEQGIIAGENRVQRMCGGASVFARCSPESVD